MALAEAYFDESGTGVDAEDLCLAGYIFEKDRAEAFDTSWRDMLAEFRLPYFHMSECVHNIGVYAHLPRGECDSAARKAIAIIKAHAAQGIAISVDKSVETALRQKSFWNNSYSFIAGQVLFGVRNWADRIGFKGSIDYLFEAGAQGWGDAHRAMTKVTEDPSLRRSFYIGTFATGLKAEHTQLQAADMLAWHWLKHCRRLREGTRKPRADFKALIEVYTDVHHYDQAAADVLLGIQQLSPTQLSELSAAVRRL